MWKLAVLFACVAFVCGQEDPRYRHVPQAYRYSDPYYNRGLYVNPEARMRADRVNYIENETPKPYSFSYTAPEEGGVGSSSRTEVADGTGRVEGSYTLTNGEGHTRVVDYVSDEAGFRATIRTDEPGTANQSPASVDLQSTAPNVYSYEGYRPEARSYRHPYSYRGVHPARAVTEELVNPEQPLEHPVVQPAVNVPHQHSYYPRRAYHPQYRRGVVY